MPVTKTTHSPQTSDGNQMLPVGVDPNQPELSVQQAAEILKMSEQHLNDLLDENIIASRTEGQSRKISREALLAYLQERKRRQAILDKMTQEAQEMGLYD